MMLRRLVVLLIVAVVLLGGAGFAQAQDGPTIRLVYFYSTDCSHCMTIIVEVLTPLQASRGTQLEIKMVEISEPEMYELLIRAEELFEVPAEERGLPTLIVGGQVLVGEDQIRERLTCVLESCAAAGGSAWPQIAGLEAVPAEGMSAGSLDLGPVGVVEPCESDEAAACAEPEAVWVAYFYEVGCQECSRAEYDIRYVRSKYPQIVVDEFNAQEDSVLFEWLGDRAGVPEDEHLSTPSFFIGDEFLIGSDITAESILMLAEKYGSTGAERSWEDFGAEESEAALQAIIDRFESFGVLAVAFFGLLDGINPCAFATIIFFVSYLSISGRKGREILLVGGVFTLGVFVAYLSVGIGFSKVLDLVDSFIASALGVEGKLLATLGRWFIGFTAALCAFLAVMSIIDFFKARRGELGDMALNLPHVLRKRINAVIRKGRNARSYVIGAFITGIVVS
ncbi:MAG: hypothetical protein MUQ10_03090, partial [Anaerolineae bacterium]|nr:hypothetical protein [Anaerolineae bacterium]